MNSSPGARETPAKVFTAKGLATRARIVAAAAELIFERGVAATGLEDVQQRAGASSSQLYHYFAGKQDLVRAVIEFQALHALDFQAPYGPLDSLDALQVWADMMIEVEAQQRQLAGGCLLGSLVSQLAETDPDARGAIDAGFVAWERWIVEGLQTMKDRGDLPAAADPGQLGAALLAALEGGLLLTQARRSITPLRSALTAALDHIRLLAASAPGSGL
jgi:TetR/AcrR family transcriptional regulator, transcriptional repressor for nem operon